MKVLAIQGSPRKNGNTDILLDQVLAVLRKRGHRSLGKIYAARLKISGCTECFRCQKVEDKPGCAIKDDMQPIYDKMLKADMIILATPVFCWGPTAQLKAILDRLFATFKFTKDPFTCLLKGKRMALIVTAGGTREDGADQCKEMYRSLMRFAGAKDVGVFIAPQLTEPAATKKDRRLLKRAADFAKRLIA